MVPALLTGCTSSVKLEYKPLQDYAMKQELMRDFDDEHFYSHKDTTPVEHRDGEINSLYDLSALNRTGRQRTTIPTVGERKLLVVPVYFTDSDTTTLNEKTIFIQNAFFGDSSMTEYDSVAGYYNKSSYGQLKITGEVAPWYNIGVASYQWKTLSSSHSTTSSIIAARAVDYIKENNLMDLTPYDTDGDENIDGIYVIYDHQFDAKSDSESLFWAYAYFTYKGENGYNLEAPYVNAYAWTSVNAITDTGNGGDNISYTNYLIHESGHLFGLSDYYNTYYTGGNNFHYQPTGSFDMMDYNIGDHSSFSKYLMKWTSPLVVKNDVKFTYNLKPFITSGEYILVPSKKYNNTPFSEYLLLEFFVPEGLNKCSEQFEYISSDGKVTIYRYPQYYGLKIYHVNASLGYYKQSGGKTPYMAALDDPDALAIIGSQKVSVDYMFDNSLSDQQVNSGHQVLYHLLESSGQNTFKDAKTATNDTLFRLNDDFGIDTFTDFTFSDGSKPQFKMRVKAISSKYITLEMNTK